MKQFIKIGKSYLSRAEIVAINADFGYVERGIENRRVHKVRVVSNGSVIHDFEHGTPEADALLKWLEEQSEVVL